MTTFLTLLALSLSASQAVAGEKYDHHQDAAPLYVDAPYSFERNSGAEPSYFLGIALPLLPEIVDYSEDFVELEFNDITFEKLYPDHYGPVYDVEGSSSATVGRHEFAPSHRFWRVPTLAANRGVLLSAWKKDEAQARPAGLQTNRKGSLYL